MRASDDRLIATVAGFSAEGYAVLDGAQIAGLPEALGRCGLSGRPLLRSPADAGVERAGPWVAPLTRQGARPVLDIAGDCSAVVFWAWPDGDAAFYAHLRRLNVVRIPTSAARGEAKLLGGDGSTNVLFRHWDPRVLGQVMPALTAGQFRRVLGLASEIAYSEYGHLRRVVSDPAWPLAPAGPLALTFEQATVITERRGAARQSRMVAYLRKSVGAPLAGTPDEQIHSHLAASEATADRLGVRTEAGHCRWAFLMYASNGEVARNPDIAAFIRAGDPDLQLKTVMVEAARSLRQPGGAV